MNIDVYFTPLGLGAGDLGGRGIVVIDVLRDTTTIVTALANGAKAVIPAATSEEAVRLASNRIRERVLDSGEQLTVKIEELGMWPSSLEMNDASVDAQNMLRAATNGHHSAS